MPSTVQYSINRNPCVVSCYVSATYLWSDTETHMQQATRPARKIYVGNLPMGSSEGEITHFFNQIMAAAKAVTPGVASLLAQAICKQACFASPHPAACAAP